MRLAGRGAARPGGGTSWRKPMTSQDSPPNEQENNGPRQAFVSIKVIVIILAAGLLTASRIGNDVSCCKLTVGAKTPNWASPETVTPANQRIPVP